MKKVNLFFLSIILLAGFFGVVNLTQADCCLIDGKCYNSSAADKCKENGLYSFSNCENWSACPAENQNTTQESANNQTAATSQTIEFANPLKVNTVSDLLTSLLNNLRGIIVVIAVVFMVIGGIMYMVSGGNENMVKRAKQTWTGAVVGLAIALAAPAFLNEILSILQAGPDVAGTGSTITIKQIAINVLNFLLSIFGVLAIISLIIGGGMYLTAYGDEKRLESGKKIVTYAIIGIVVALSALAVTRQIASLINVTQ